MANLVLEIGTEEMPANAVEQALGQLKQAAEKGLESLRLHADHVDVFGTPRRMILYAAGVPSTQPDQVRLVRGPSRNVAFDASGNPTGAATGFARKQGVSVESLEIIETPQGEYIQARVTDIGCAAENALGRMLEDAVKDLFFPKMMRWGEGSMRFVRPIRWILALLDDKQVTMNIAGVSSGRLSRGHRFLAPEEFNVPDADSLLPLLERAYVMYNPINRREMIREQADHLAREAGGRIPWDQGLLDENNWLVEWPTALVGRFDDRFLKLPRPVLVTAMKKHQRFFPVEDEKGNLLPLFISVRNGGAHGLDIVQDGNERVLTARFSDASFFFDQDIKTTLEEMTEKLGRLVFQEKLGTIAQKRQRLILLVEKLAELIGFSEEDKHHACRAASLCKADLVSNMVIELPSLQGVMGREYALKDGENRLVAESIAEHYLPRNADDTAPSSSIGSLLAIADRIDTLTGYVGIGIMPSGSSDPFGLRRAAQGVVQIIADKPEYPPIAVMISLASEGYTRYNDREFVQDELQVNMSVLFDQRLQAWLNEAGIRYDLSNAVLAVHTQNETVCALLKRGLALQGYTSAEHFIDVLQAASRVANILKSSGSQNTEVHTDLFEKEAESNLYSAGISVMKEAEVLVNAWQFDSFYNILEKLTSPVNVFFDAVMVMAEDPALRKNRIAILRIVDSVYRMAADFTQIVA
jgi:glycyl-tRNA synthetase beta chain